MVVERQWKSSFSVRKGSCLSGRTSVLNVFSVSNNMIYPYQVTSFFCLFCNFEHIQLSNELIFPCHATSLFIPPESFRKPEVFRCFQRVQKETSCMKWVKFVFLFVNLCLVSVNLDIRYINRSIFVKWPNIL